MAAEGGHVPVEQETTDLVRESPVKLAWGGAGMVCTESLDLTFRSPLNESDHSFHNVMSEDLAKSLHEREEENCLAVLMRNVEEFDTFQVPSTEDTSNDLLLAQLLQYEFDREHDSQVTREEKFRNRNCKVSVSYNKYKRCPAWYGADSNEESDSEDDSARVIDSFEARQKSDPVIPACGYTRHGNKLVTKHDAKIAYRKNAEKIMSLPPGINTGDGGAFDMELSNQVYNKLKRDAMSEIRRKNRVHDKVEKATAEMALDPKTRLILFKMVNNATLESVDGIISTGKEAVVVHAQGGIYEKQNLPKECAVKIFKTTLTDFKTRERYIREDYRFKDRMSKNNNRLTIQLWAEKEFHNLVRLWNAGISSPRPLLIRKHVLVMSFIGEDHRAAPKLKDAVLSHSEWKDSYVQVTEAMTTIFRKCCLVHADMSEYNVLWHNKRCHIIDLGQAVEPTHPHALEFLYRDCSNIIKFYKGKNLPDLPSPLELFEQVTGMKVSGQEDPLEMIRQIDNSQQLWKENIAGHLDHFDILWAGMELASADQSSDLSGEGDSDENITPAKGEPSNSDGDFPPLSSKMAIQIGQRTPDQFVNRRKRRNRRN